MEKNTIDKKSFLMAILHDLQVNKDNKFDFGKGNTIIVKNNLESEQSEVLISIEDSKITIKERNNKFKFTCYKNSIFIEYSNYIKFHITNSENYCLKFNSKNYSEILNFTEKGFLYSKTSDSEKCKTLCYNDGSKDFKAWRDELCNSEEVLVFEEYVIGEIMKHFPNFANFILENVNFYRKSCNPVRKKIVSNN